MRRSRTSKAPWSAWGVRVPAANGRDSIELRPETLQLRRSPVFWFRSYRQSYHQDAPAWGSDGLAALAQVASARALPASVVGPVLRPPWKRQRRLPGSLLAWQRRQAGGAVLHPALAQLQGHCGSPSISWWRACSASASCSSYVAMGLQRRQRGPKMKKPRTVAGLRWVAAPCRTPFSPRYFRSNNPTAFCFRLWYGPSAAGSGMVSAWLKHGETGPIAGVLFDPVSANSRPRQ